MGRGHWAEITVGRGHMYPVKGTGYLFAYIPLSYANLLHGYTEMQLSYSSHNQHNSCMAIFISYGAASIKFL